MTLTEPLWYCGCNQHTKREIDKPATWIGLTADDGERLASFIDLVGTKPYEIHTHVPVGIIEGIDDIEPGDPMRKVLLGRWPYRIDCVIMFERCTWLIECKQRLTHHVLGQVFCYWFWWMRDVEDPILDRAIVVCEDADADVINAADYMGVDVVRV